MQNALAGLFCASLNGMDNQRTTSPTRAFPPSGDLPLLPSPHTHALRHATLAAEHVCTENLTPFLKLLPCPGRAGIAALLAPHKIFDTNWHGLGVHVRWKAGEGVELVLAVQAVFDPVRSSGDDKRGAYLYTCLNTCRYQCCLRLGLPEYIRPHNTSSMSRSELQRNTCRTAVKHRPRFLIDTGAVVSYG